MYPTQPHWHTQPTPPSASSIPPSAGRSRGRPRASISSVRTLALAALLFLALASCGSTALLEPGAASSPTAGAGQSSNATATPTTLVPAVTPTTTPPSIASLVPSVQEVANTPRYSTASTVTASATCPQGTFALGGGWTVPTTGSRVFAATLTGNIWTVSATHTSAGTAITISAYVECLTGVTGAVVTRRAVTSSAQPTAFDTASAFCDAGEIPVGFGFDFGAASANLELQATNPETFESGVWWNFWVMNHDAVGYTISLYVECLSNVNASATFPGKEGGYVYASQTGSVSLPCPSGAIATGGGLDYKGKSIGNLYDLHATAGGWQGAIYGVTGYGLIPLVPTVWAVCLSFS